ncbi:glycosyltransferase [Methylomarinum sp. Ch1-1]|uniref:Glycosyltransferase n=1 Tax=Methylomarinum roseum TaxID=3067653 RepID=A0AAU7NTI3_9GAMM|nr:glycosyltransferase [Methylomarinum sp. Ch1-1]MDP4519709.1 glycosyltransferase [Methylomarinum sp. Ch1-1]
MTTMLEQYAAVTGEDVIRHLRQLAAPLQGKSVVHVNSTRVGGGVAEILDQLVPLTRELGIDAHWEVISGDRDFYQCTKSMHNAIQGNRIAISDALLQHFEEVNAQNAKQLQAVLEQADFVFIHDPQPAALLKFCPRRRGQWIWRCHIDASHPHRYTWRFIEKFVRGYDASIFSLPQFARRLPHPAYIIPPSIDPLSDKNIALDTEELASVRSRFDLNPEAPLIAQISRFDRFKDPVGVIEAYKLARQYLPNLQLVLAGGGASDDPEGEAVLAEVRLAAGDDPNIKVLVLPPDSHRTINALQRLSDIVLQKSIKEGFGLTVTEALWKGKPVIGGDTGGIRLQVVNFHTGFLVNTPQGAALRIRYLFNQRQRMQEMGTKSKQFVRDNFLLTRQLREYLTLMVGLHHGAENRIDLG